MKKSLVHNGFMFTLVNLIVELDFTLIGRIAENVMNRHFPQGFPEKIPFCHGPRVGLLSQVLPRRDIALSQSWHDSLSRPPPSWNRANRTKARAGHLGASLEIRPSIPARAGLEASGRSTP